MTSWIPTLLMAAGGLTATVTALAARGNASEPCMSPTRRQREQDAYLLAAIPGHRGRHRAGSPVTSSTS